MLGQRPRRWANITPTLVQHLVFAGVVLGPASYQITQPENDIIIVVLSWLNHGRWQYIGVGSVWAWAWVVRGQCMGFGK